MKFLNKSLVPLLVAGSTLLVISCQEEDPIKEPDTENPVVHLEMSETPEELSGEVALKATVEDNQGIERVSFYLDDKVIGEATEEPFEINWDSGEIEDGSYILKVIATDKSGNKAEDSREVSIRNSLMSIYMEGDYRSDSFFYDFSEEWFFLSDKKGNVIGEPKKLKPTETISWRRPEGFTDEKIMINKLTYLNRESTRLSDKILYKFFSYADVPASDMVLSSSHALGFKELGSAEININLPEGSTYNLSARTEFSETPNSGAYGGQTITLTPKIYDEEQQKCLVTYYKTLEGEVRVPQFYWMDIQLNERYQISTDAFLPMSTKEVSFPDEKHGGSATLYGHLKDNDGKERGTIRRGIKLDQIRIGAETGSGNLNYPEDIFSEYTFIGGLYKFEYYYDFKLSSIPDVIAKPDFTASVKNSDVKSVELTTNKKHDVLFVRWKYEETLDGILEYVDRRLYLGKETDGQYVLPDVPEVLTKEYPVLKNPLKYQDITLYDYENVSSYQEYFDGIYGSNSDNIDLYYYELLLLRGIE